MPAARSAPGILESHSHHRRVQGLLGDRLRDRDLLTAEPLTGSVAAVSVGVVDGISMLDLCYTEDSAADTDLNLAMTGDGAFIEVQGTAERTPFDRKLLDELLDLGAAGCAQLTELQRVALAS